MPNRNGHGLLPSAPEDGVYMQAVDPTVVYVVSYEKWEEGQRKKAGAPILKEQEKQREPCVVYAIVGDKWYLDLEQSKAESPRCTEEMILAKSRECHGEVPILGGLERKIVEERREAARKEWLKTPHGNRRAISACP